MDKAKRVYWSVDECQWVDCPTLVLVPELPEQRTEEPEPAVLAES